MLSCRDVVSAMSEKNLLDPKNNELIPSPERDDDESLEAQLGNNLIPLKEPIASLDLLLSRSPLEGEKLAGGVELVHYGDIGLLVYKDGAPVRDLSTLSEVDQDTIREYLGPTGNGKNELIPR